MALNLREEQTCVGKGAVWDRVIRHLLLISQHVLNTIHGTATSVRSNKRAASKTSNAESATLKPKHFIMIT